MLHVGILLASLLGRRSVKVIHDFLQLEHKVGFELGPRDAGRHRGHIWAFHSHSRAISRVPKHKILIRNQAPSSSYSHCLSSLGNMAEEFLQSRTGISFYFLLKICKCPQDQKKCHKTQHVSFKSQSQHVKLRSLALNPEKCSKQLMIQRMLWIKC